MVLLSVIIPTYNSEATIERCLKSLFSQSFKDFEICIIDGASVDTTLSIIARLRPHFKNIRVLSERDKGTYDAMNKAIDIAKGDWLYFLGSDDEVYDQYVFADIFKQPVPCKCGVIYGNVHLSTDAAWAKAGRIYDGFFDLDKLLNNNICHQAIFYRKELFQRFERYKIQYRVCADWEVNLRFFSRTEFKYVERTIANFYGGGLSSQITSDQMAQDIERIRKRTRREYKLQKITSFFQFIPSIP